MVVTALKTHVAVEALPDRIVPPVVVAYQPSLDDKARIKLRVILSHRTDYRALATVEAQPHLSIFYLSFHVEQVITSSP